MVWNPTVLYVLVLPYASVPGTACFLCFFGPSAPMYALYSYVLLVFPLLTIVAVSCVS